MPERRTKTLLALPVVAALACRGDRSITRGIANESAWTRRLAATVPVGTTADSAPAIMETNGFLCRAGIDSVAYLWCSKSSGGLVREKWNAVLNFDRRARVSETRALYGLVLWRVN
jgi:hypothetical protein